MLAGLLSGLLGMVSSPVRFVNPLKVDGFREPGGWGTHEADGAHLPLLCFLPGMDGSLSTAFMQYPELGTEFELSCLVHTEGMASRATFEELVDACVDHVRKHAPGGRRVLLVGESFGATLAVAVARRLEMCDDSSSGGGMSGGASGIVLVNPATSYNRSTLRAVGPACARLSGFPLAALYPLALVALAALVLTPAYQAPAMAAMLASAKIPALLNSPPREAYLGRVALGAFLGSRAPGIAPLGELLRVQIFSPADLGFRLDAWLAVGAADADAHLPLLRTPTLTLVGALDRLLPSVDEAHRLRALLGSAADVHTSPWRGAVVVRGAGHASTLGNRVDLLAEIRRAFAAELNLAPDAPRSHDRGDQGDGWARGMLDRSFPPLRVHEYTQYNAPGQAEDRQT